MYIACMCVNMENVVKLGTHWKQIKNTYLENVVVDKVADRQRHNNTLGTHNEHMRNTYLEDVVVDKVPDRQRHDYLEHEDACQEE